MSSPAGWLRAALRPARHLPDRLLHPLRRTRARRLVASNPRSVLFICLGNICRSPYAAASFRRLAADAGMEVGSAGFIGPGRASPVRARGAALRRGLDLEDHVSQLLDRESVLVWDLLVVMEPAQARRLRRELAPHPRVLVLGDLDPLPIRTRAIRDPYNGTASDFDACYERIDRCLEELARSLPAAADMPALRG